MEPVMTRNQEERPHGTPGFDPRRSSDIRGLLTSMVADAAKPRRARLSQAMFALAATAALLFAGGTGAGTVMAYDHLSDSEATQTAASSASSVPATSELLSGAPAARPAGDLLPILVIDGEVGYAHKGALEAAKEELSEVHVEAVDATKDVSAMVPIYRADGVTLVGYYDPVSLFRE
jgi:hypothetical protein